MIVFENDQDLSEGWDINFGESNRSWEKRA